MGYPDNAAYAVVGYVVTLAVVSAYTLSLYVRIRKVR
jgi:hypothetical protein